MRGAMLLLAMLAGCGDSPASEDRTEKAAPLARVPVATPDCAEGADCDRGETGAAPYRAAVPADKPLVSRGTSSTSPQQPIERRNAPDYAAIGTEPFWAVRIEGDRLLMERPDQAPIRLSVRRSIMGGEIHYRGEGLALTITPGPCSDGMSDAIWSDRVQIAFSGGTLKGCGGERQMPDY